MDRLEDISSLFAAQSKVFSQHITYAVPNKAWKYLIADEESLRLLHNVFQDKDNIIDKKYVLDVLTLETKRASNDGSNALYILSPNASSVECVRADLIQKKYLQYFLLFTSPLPPNLWDKLFQSQVIPNQIAKLEIIHANFYPFESRLATFRNPYSFPLLINPAYGHLVQQHIAELTEKIMSACIALGENPIIRYYRPHNPKPSHQSHLLSEYIAVSVQKELDAYNQFPPQDPKRRAFLYVVDRSMDLAAPLLHESTYQAMAHELLDIRQDTKITYEVTLSNGCKQNFVISDDDEMWVKYRHLHIAFLQDGLKDESKKLQEHSEKFNKGTTVDAVAENWHDLPKYQNEKNWLTLHSSAAVEIRQIFETCMLAELTTLEQTLVTSTDSRKTKDTAVDLVKLLDDNAVVKQDRLRLIALYILYKNGLIEEDIQKLLLHSKLPLYDEAILRNLELLGARIIKPFKDTTPAQHLFSIKECPEGTYIGLQYESHLKRMLEAHCEGTLDAEVFRYADPRLAPSPDEMREILANTSLRSARTVPTWAATRGTSQPKQRVIVFMAGGATYSELRACYNISDQWKRDIFLLTSHMWKPGDFLQQLGGLSGTQQGLGLPMDKPVPAHVRDEIARPPSVIPPGGPSSAASVQASSSKVPIEKMASMSLNGSSKSRKEEAKVEKEKEKPKKEKKHHHFFSRK